MQIIEKELYQKDYNQLMEETQVKLIEIKKRFERNCELEEQRKIVQKCFKHLGGL